MWRRATRRRSHAYRAAHSGADGDFYTLADRVAGADGDTQAATNRDSYSGPAAGALHRVFASTGRTASLSGAHPVR